MVRSQARRAFTLIELLTVIAIIAILTAILFPVAGTVREQARSSDCMTKLHQLWVSANVYRQDEGGFPPVLLNYAEAGTQDATGRCVSTGLPWQPPLDPVNNCVVNADDTRRGTLYREQIKDLNIFRCPDNQRKNKAEPVVAYFPPRPSDWPANAGYIGDYLATQGCATAGALGTQVCNTATGKPYYFYAVDSYDIGPAIDPVTGAQINQADGSIGYSLHYTPDWTGPTRPGPTPGSIIGTGATDLPYQLKYENPPDDKTLFTFCSWHQAIAHTGSVPAISMGGSAKKMNIAQALSKSASLYAK
jgi:prepilin-type N-terminal cleavage/methylation domain-containing protein